MKIHLVIFSLFFSSLAFAEEPAQELPPLDPSYMAVHPMVLFTHSSQIFASNLPGYKKPHNAQVLYKIANKDLAVLQTVRDADLITIKPKPFNLQRLIRGEKLVIQADLYSGHYNRGGMRVYRDIPLAFEKQLYARTFDDIKPSSKRQEYDVVELRDDYRFYIHRIQQAPSFDHILGVDLQASCLSRFTTSSAVPKEIELQYKFINCGTIKPLYFETEDFQAKSF